MVESSDTPKSVRCEEPVGQRCLLGKYIGTAKRCHHDAVAVIHGRHLCTLHAKAYGWKPVKLTLGQRAALLWMAEIDPHGMGLPHTTNYPQCEQWKAHKPASVQAFYSLERKGLAKRDDGWCWKLTDEGRAIVAAIKVDPRPQPGDRMEHGFHGIVIVESQYGPTSCKVRALRDGKIHTVFDVNLSKV